MTNAFHMTIGTGRGEVAKANAAFAEFAEAHALPGPVRRSVHVALDELLTNTVAHGFAGRTGGEVSVEVELRTDQVSVTLTDDGTPFDPFGRAAPDTALSVEQRRIGGLGIHLVRRMMDEVSYHRRADRNVVVLAKRLTAGMSAGHRGGKLMDITTRTERDATIVAIAGNLDSNTSPQAQTALDYISSAGLRVLLGTAKRLSGAGSALRLFGLNDTVREVFEISGFATILAVYATEAEAVAGR